MFRVVIFGAIIRPDPEGSRENPETETGVTARVTAGSTAGVMTRGTATIPASGDGMPGRPYPAPSPGAGGSPSAPRCNGIFFRQYGQMT